MTAAMTGMKPADMAEKKSLMLKSPFHDFAGNYGDYNRGCRGDEAGKHDRVWVRGAQFFTELDSDHGDYGGEGHVYDCESAHVITGGVSEVILCIQLFHGSQGEDGGAVTCAENIGHEAHDYAGNSLRITLFRKKKFGERKKYLGDFVYQACFFCDFHQTAPHCHDTGQTDYKCHCI